MEQPCRSTWRGHGCILRPGHDGPHTDDRSRWSSSAEDEPIGVKADAEKPSWTLVPWSAMAQVVAVLDYGARKYDRDNWRKVHDAKRRYADAALRHLTAWLGGEKADPESGLPHLAHAACCVLFLLEFELEVPRGE